MTQAKARVVNYDRNSSIKVLATVITVVNYDRNGFIIQATGLNFAVKLIAFCFNFLIKLQFYLF
jgi:hypothetical protein